ncbi:glutaminyl-peptide cyclotransferase [Rhodococcus sp. HNM0569]|uniref:glutaminyl-peptide cyclotransferase n=1 Tax=Rhodococcus sp. HNM0569 TaxID=2716340 RepID=UPI00146A3DA7|nr:glutaminyl-peptide cyclotransferase [Rhodococcus sp. HNM0569]NLU82429.1 glutaminyl-peptide cyclotransferase [Rhodococcus sp. HNM0569]
MRVGRASGVAARAAVLRTTVLGTAAVAVLSACSADPEPGAAASSTEAGVEVVDTLPHDAAAFTQGLEIHDGVLYEGTGLVGSSWLRATELESGRELARVDLPAPLFGEGVTVDGDTVWQLTWRNGIAIERDATTLAERRRVDVDGEGWGICTRPDAAGDDALVTSDGSATLTFRDRGTFAETGTVRVTHDGTDVTQLNELECMPDGTVYANVWQQDTIVQIDPDDGSVVRVIDASALRDLLPDDTTSGARTAPDVLNGIAAIPGTDHFLVTGKNWPRMFEVRFTP